MGTTIEITSASGTIVHAVLGDAGTIAVGDTVQCYGDVPWTATVEAMTHPTTLALAGGSFDRISDALRRHRVARGGPVAILLDRHVPDGFDAIHVELMSEMGGGVHAIVTPPVTL